MGTRAILPDYSYDKPFNFNLMSLTRLLCKGWHTIKGDVTGINVEDGNGGIIKFDIVVRTAKGVVFVCRFFRDAETATASTDVGTRMDINKAHGLLGHGNKEVTRKLGQELGWIITRGKTKLCEHCARSKAKQKNVCKKSTAPKAEAPGG